MKEVITMQRVAFVKRHESCFVVPGHLVLGTPDNVRFGVIGNCHQVTIMFPNGSIFGQPSPYIVTLSNVSGAGHPRFTVESVPNNPALEGVYPYTVYCHDTGSFAVGGSDAEIIIQT
jgi:hypothetical protein